MPYGMSVTSMTWWGKLITAITIIVVSNAILTAVVGSLLVILSYRRDPRLRNVHGLYLAHLAFCDLVTGAVTMPILLIYTVMDYVWPFGRVTCLVLLVETRVFTQMSVMLVVLVSVDHFIMVTYPVFHRTTEYDTLACVFLSLGWCYSVLLHAPAIIMWDDINGEVYPRSADMCLTGFHRQFYLVLIVQVLSLLVPVLVYTVINTLLCWKVRINTRVDESDVARKNSGVRYVLSPSVASGGVRYVAQGLCACLTAQRGNTEMETSLDTEPETSQDAEMETSQDAVMETSVDKDGSNTNTFLATTSDAQQAGNAGHKSRSSSSHEHTMPKRQSSPRRQSKTRQTGEGAGLTAQKSTGRFDLKLTNSLRGSPIDAKRHRGSPVDENRYFLSAKGSNQPEYQLPLYHSMIKKKWKLSHHDKYSVSFSTTTSQLPDSESENGHICSGHASSIPRVVSSDKRCASSSSTIMRRPYPGTSVDPPSRGSHMELPDPEQESLSFSLELRRMKRKEGRGRRGRRATLILKSLVLALVVCWLPHSVVVIVNSLCDDCVLGSRYVFVFHFTNWLLCFKSSLNPFLYALTSPSYRRNFKQLLQPFFHCLLYAFLCTLGCRYLIYECICDRS